MLPRRRLSWPAAWLGLALVLAALAAFIFYRLVTLPERAAAAGGAQVEHLFQATRRAFADLLGGQPRIVVNRRVVVEQATPLLELAVLQREMSVERETADTWLHSTKRLRLRGTYRIKAGYDLRQPFEAGLDTRQPHLVRVRLPPAKVLSVELEKLDVLAMESGLWNPVHPEDFELEVNGLTLDAHRQAQQDGLAAEAAKMLTEQLQEKLGPEIRLQIDPALPKPVPLR